MKNIILFGIILLLQCTNNSEQVKHIDALYTARSLTIDGVLREPPWELASPVLLKENRSGKDVSDHSLQTTVKTCYDDSTLYFAFVCKDPDIWTSFTQRDEYLWEEEAVEIFIDVPLTARFNLPGIKTAVNVSGTLNQRGDTDDQWTVEIAVPFTDLANENILQVDKQTNIKINFYRLDKNRDMESMSSAWSPTGARFHKPEVFGRLIFK